MCFFAHPEMPSFHPVFCVFRAEGSGVKMLEGVKPSACFQKLVSCGNDGKRNEPHGNGFVSCGSGSKMCNNNSEQVPAGTCFLRYRLFRLILTPSEMLKLVGRFL